MRDAVAGWFGHGDQQRAQRQAQQLEQTRSDMQDGTLDEATAAGRWQGRLEALLDEYPELADELAALLAQLRQTAGGRAVTAGDHGLAAGGTCTSRRRRVGWPAG